MGGERIAAERGKTGGVGSGQQSSDREGVSALRALIARGRPTVAEVVELLDRAGSSEQRELLGELHRTLGNEFVQQVISVMSAPRGQGELIADAPRDQSKQPTATGHVGPTASDPAGRAVVVEQERQRVSDRNRIHDDQLQLNPGTDRSTRRELAVYHESVMVTDTDGDTLLVDANYRIETRPGETDRENMHIATDRRLVLTLANGQKITAVLKGDAIALVEVNSKFEPLREINETSIHPSNSGQVYLPATDEWLPTIFGKGGQASLAADAQGNALLAYGDPLAQLAALKAMMQTHGVARGGQKLEKLHAFTERAEEVMPYYRQSVRAHVDARLHYRDGSPQIISEIEDAIREINRGLAEIGEVRHGGADREKLLKLRQELLDLRTEAQEAHPYKKSTADHLIDLAGVPYRFVERAGEGVAELGRTLVDASVLGVAALGKLTGIGTFDWKPISKVGKAAEEGATSKDVAWGIATGIIDQWSDAIERMHNGDYSGILDTSVDTVLLVDGAIETFELVAAKAPAVMARAGAAAKKARGLIAGARRLPTDVADTAAAMADALDALTGPATAPGMQMSTAGAGGGGGGPKLPSGGGGTLGDAKAAFRAKKLELAKGRAVDAVKSRVGATKGAPDVAEWAQRIERIFDGDLKGAADFFRNLELSALDPVALMKEVEQLLASHPIGVEQLQALLKRSMSGKVADPVKFLGDARWLASRTLSSDARAMLLDKAASGKLDLEWLRTTSLTDAELNQLGMRTSVPWNQYRNVANAAKPGGAPVESGQIISANLQIRGVAGELTAQDIDLPDGLKIKSHGAPELDGKEPDYILVDEAGALADLEVKATRPEEWPSLLKEGGNMAALPDGHPMLRMEAQLNASVARGRKVYLAVTDGMSGVSKGNLKLWLSNNVSGPVQVVFMDEATILATADKLRQHLGIPKPGFAPRPK